MHFHSYEHERIFVCIRVSEHGEKIRYDNFLYLKIGALKSTIWSKLIITKNFFQSALIERLINAYRIIWLRSH